MLNYSSIAMILTALSNTFYISRQSYINFCHPSLLFIHFLKMALKAGKILAMITGGSGGLGRATASHLLKQGARVAILDLPKEDENAGHLDSEECIFCPCDITDSNDIRDAIEMTKTKFGQPNVLINCAGIATSMSVFHRKQSVPHSLEVFEDQINTNVIGTFDAIRLLVPEMIKNEPDGDGQRGVIINTSSIVSHEGEQGQVAYSASTAAINSMTLPLSRELCRHGIRVCTVSVGYFDTPHLASVPEKILKYLISQTPFPRRLGQPEEFAMLSQTIIENPYLNGEIMRLDGALRTAH